MIQEYSFGKIVINNKSYSNDLKIISGRIIPSWWRENGHVVEKEDIEDILKSQPDIIIVGKGSPGWLKVSETLREFLSNNYITLIEESSASAVLSFNFLYSQGKHVSAGFHLTC